MELNHARIILAIIAFLSGVLVGIFTTEEIGIIIFIASFFYGITFLQIENNHLILLNQIKKGGFN